jgi:dihydroorotase
MINFEEEKFYEGSVYVKDGHIVDAYDESEAAEVIDASGKYVMPGMIDTHSHYYYGGSNCGISADSFCLPCGITTGVDAGTTGIMAFKAFHDSCIVPSITELLAYVNISPEGLKAWYKHGENHDPDDMNPDDFRKLFRKYPNTLKGLKVRVSKETSEGYGLEPLKKAVELADMLEKEGHKCLIAVHCANLPNDAPIDQILDVLRPGDSYTHLFQNLGETIFNKDRTVNQSLQDARKRGIYFETGNGGIHWTIPNLRDAYQDGFYPDIISSDAVVQTIWMKPSLGLLHAMNTSLLCGMKELQIMKATTYTPAKLLDMLHEIGTLNVGTRADVTVMDIVDSEQIFFDRFGNSQKGSRVFVPLMTLREGKIAFRQMYFYK